MWVEEGFRTLHDVQSFRGVRNPARSQNARFSLAHRLAATFPGAGNGMSAMRVLRSRSAGEGGHDTIVRGRGVPPACRAGPRPRQALSRSRRGYPPADVSVLGGRKKKEWGYL